MSEAADPALFAGRYRLLVLELVEGESLSRRIERGGPLEAEAVRRLGIELGQALAHCHARGCCTATSSRATSCSTATGGPA